MRKIYLLIVLVFQIGFSQIEKNSNVQFKANFGLELKSNYFFGDNYLSKGHKNPTIGFGFHWNFLEYKKFNLGVSFEKSVLRVTDYSIGGNIDKSNITVYNSNLSYQIPINAKLALEPNIFYGQLYVKQKNGTKNYGVQNGNDLGFGICLNYKLNKSIQVYSNLAFSHYFLTANTTPEFENYFGSSNCLSLSLGIKLF